MFELLGEMRDGGTERVGEERTEKRKEEKTHSFRSFFRPAKAPLVSSIVPEMSLWSSSL